MGTIRERSNGTFEVAFNSKKLGIKGRSVTADTREEAERIESHYQRQIDNLIVPERLKLRAANDVDLTLASVLDTYLLANDLVDSEFKLLKAFLRSEFANEKVNQMAFNDFAERYVQHLKRVEGLKPGTIKHKVGALSRACAELVRSERLITNPFDRLPRNFAAYTKADEKAGATPQYDEQRDRRPSREELHRIEAVLTGRYENPSFERKLPARPDLLLIFNLALLTGMRLSEIYTLKRTQISLDKMTITLNKTKNGTSRQIPLSATGREILAQYMSQHRGQSLFGPNEPDPKVSSRFSRAYARVFAHAGCEDLKFHDLRHEAICRMFLYTNLRTHEIMKITGHRTESCLGRYLNLRGHELAANFDGMDSAFRHEQIVMRSVARSVDQASGG